MRLLRKRARDTEIYERIIDLAISVAEGRLDPFDVDVGRFLERLGEVEAFDEGFIDLLLLDVRALHGLITILEAQSRKLRDRGYGIYLNRLLVRMAAEKLGEEDLVTVLASAWRPIMELEYMDQELLDEAFTYFINLLDLGERERIRPRLMDVEFDISPELFREPVDLASYTAELLDELRRVAGEQFIDYFEFVYRGERPLLRAYAVSFLISEGWVDVKIDRLKKKIFIRPRDSRLVFRNPSSIVVVMGGGEG